MKKSNTCTMDSHCYDLISEMTTEEKDNFDECIATVGAKIEGHDENQHLSHRTIRERSPSPDENEDSNSSTLKESLFPNIDAQGEKEDLESSEILPICGESDDSCDDEDEEAARKNTHRLTRAPIRVELEWWTDDPVATSLLELISGRSIKVTPLTDDANKILRESELKNMKNQISFVSNDLSFVLHEGTCSGDEELSNQRENFLVERNLLDDEIIACRDRLEVQCQKMHILEGLIETAHECYASLYESISEVKDKNEHVKNILYNHLKPSTLYKDKTSALQSVKGVEEGVTQCTDEEEEEKKKKTDGDEESDKIEEMIKFQSAMEKASDIGMKRGMLAARFEPEKTGRELAEVEEVHEEDPSLKKVEKLEKEVDGGKKKVVSFELPKKQEHNFYASGNVIFKKKFEKSRAVVSFSELCIREEEIKDLLDEDMRDLIIKKVKCNPKFLMIKKTCFLKEFEITKE